MSRLQRALAPVSLALGLAALLPASAVAGTTVTFPDGMPTETTVSIVDPGASSPTVQLTVTAANAADLGKTKVLLGRGSYVFGVIGTDGVREVEDEFENVYDDPCTVAGAPRTDIPVTVGNGTFTANLPKGDVVAFEQVDKQVVIDSDDEGRELPPDTQYSLQLRAVRQFNVWDNGDMIEPSSGFASVTVATKPVQKVTMLGAPAATTTARTAHFTWFITAGETGDVTSCWLDVDGPSATEVPCTASGASLTGLSLGAHTLTVYPADGETSNTASWVVVAETTPPLPPTVPNPPKTNPNDVDGDGIETTWLVAGKPAAAPKTPKLSVSGTKVKLTLAGAPKGAKSIRVYRADGKGEYKLVKTVKAASKTFTDTKVKPGTTYKYKTVAVNAKGQQGKDSGAATAKVAKRK